MHLNKQMILLFASRAHRTPTSVYVYIKWTCCVSSLLGQSVAYIQTKAVLCAEGISSTTNMLILLPYFAINVHAGASAKLYPSYYRVTDTG
jgi:hypothetical protein